MAKNKLTDTAIRAVKTGDPRTRLSDGEGLYLRLFVKGVSHGWRFDYSFQGRRKGLSFGAYPNTSLALAREKAEAARRLLANGVDPSEHRKGERARVADQLARAKLEKAGLPSPDSFEHVAREWYDKRKTDWAPSYGQRVIRRLEADVFPFIGRTPIDDLTPPKILEVLRKIEGRGVVETAHRALESCSQVFRYAVAAGYVTSDPCRDLKGALARPRVKHFPAITDPTRLGDLMRAIHGYQGTYVVRAALKLAPLVLLRPGELRFATWDEFDLDAGVWTVPSHRMKRSVYAKANGKPHIVPLSRQVLTITEN